MLESEFKAPGLIGKFYCPSNADTPLPALILLSGSEGGIPGSNAIPLYFIERLVENDFAILSLAYFGMDDLPKNLENIELEHFAYAIHWLQTNPTIKSEAIGVIGQSRGGELALLLGTLYKEFKAIVAFVPSNMRIGGFPFPNKPAWIWQGHPLTPFLGGLTDKKESLTELNDLNQATKVHLIPPHQNSLKDPYIIADLFAARNAMDNHMECVITVETITCPILLFSGNKDAIWPSQFYCDAIMTRLQQHQFNKPFQHINYQDAGHGLMSHYDDAIYHPVGGFWCKLGGNLEGNRIANQNSVEITIQFLSILK